MNKKIGIYHKSCIDGTTAAAVLLRKFPDIMLFPVGHSDIEDTLAQIREIDGKDSEIYFVDITAGIEDLLKGKYKITAIDHHIGGKERMEKIVAENDNVTYIFDNNKSGASLAWSYLFPDEKAPEIIKYVEDSDLWTQKYDDTKYVTNYLFMHINSPETVLKFFDEDITALKEKGKTIADYSDIQIDRLVDSRESIDLKIGEYTVPAHNVTIYESAVGHKISESQDQTAVMFNIKGDSVKFSFRSIDGQSPSALELAKLLGGGGHQNASGAEIPLKDFLKMIVL